MAETRRLLATAAACALFALWLTGCVQTEVLVKVNPDGSGTLEETVMLSKEAAGQIRTTLESLEKDPTGQGEPEGPVDLWKEKDISARAAKMGEGVRFEKMERLDSEGFEGYRAVFSFADVNSLLVDQNPGKNVPSELRNSASR